MTHLIVWQANDEFFGVLNSNFWGGKARIGVTHTKPNKERTKRVEVSEDLEISLAAYVSLFLNSENFSPVARLKFDDLSLAFAICGNHPEYADEWYELAETRSLSVGDVIQVVHDDKAPEWFVVDRFGFSPVCNPSLKIDESFAESLAQFE